MRVAGEEGEADDEHETYVSVCTVVIEAVAELLVWIGTFFDVESHECIKETRSTVIMGEDLDDLVDDDKPVRALTHFAIFDPRTRELISLDELYAGETHRQFEAFGTVTPVFANEEDAGQDDDYESGKRDRFVQRLRTSTIFDFMIDYSGDE